MLENMGSLSSGLRELIGLPQFADLPDLRNGGMPSFEPAMELAAIAQEYARVGIPIWVEACKRFEKEVALQRGKGESPDSAGDALELWNTVLDRYSDGIQSFFRIRRSAAALLTRGTASKTRNASLF